MKDQDFQLDRRDWTRPLDDLEGVRAACLALLEEAARRPDAEMRTGVLATSGPDGAPEARVIVVRGFDAGAGVLTLFTDQRSGKMAHLVARPRASLALYDAERGLQIRVRGEALCRPPSEGNEAWRNVPERSRILYRTAKPPGTAIPAPEPEIAAGGDGRENFAVLDLEIAELEWLQLAEPLHRRALFACERSSPPQWRGTWLVP